MDLRGVTPDIVSRLSEAGRYVSLYRSVNEKMTFVYAERGLEKRHFDPLVWPSDQRGEPLSEERGLVFGEPERIYPYEQAVVLIERITGLRITEEWLFHVPRLIYQEHSVAGA
jgi:hypothetical protein